MKFTTVRKLHAVFSQPEKPQAAASQLGPRIATIHGFMARKLMRNHLVHFMNQHNYADTTIYDYLHPTEAIAESLTQAHKAGRATVLIGFSQGGFEAVKVAKLLEANNTPINLLVIIGCGGLGRALPWQWGFNPRLVPTNVALCLNYFSLGDRLGSDNHYTDNLALSTHWDQRVENHVYPSEMNISHAELAKCFPQEKIHPAVKSQLFDRLLQELQSIS